MLTQWNTIKMVSLCLGVGLSLGCAVGGMIVGGGYLFSHPSKTTVLPWNGYPMNTVDWFGVIPPLVAQTTGATTVSGLSAPSFKLLGTTLFTTERWALLSADQPNGLPKWVAEGEVYGAYLLRDVRTRSVTFVAKESEKGKGEWVLSLNTGAADTAGAEMEKQDCVGVIKVPRMAMDVLNQQQAVLIQGVEAVKEGKGGVRVKPELAALLSGLGFMAGDVIIEANSQSLKEPQALLRLVVNPLLQGRSMTIKGQRGMQEKQWRLINETSCK